MLACNDLVFRYEGAEALRGVSLQFAPGRLTMVLGPNGCGKTTLLKILSGILSPQSGQALLDGQDIRRYPPRVLAKKLAFLSQKTHVEYGFSVSDIVRMGRYAHLSPFRGEAPPDFAAVREAMEQTGVLELSERNVLHLSGGEMQRVFLARALAQGAPYLLLDEPVTGLDIAHQLEFLSLLKRLCAERSLTVVCVMHDIGLACRFAQEIVLLKNGVLADSGAPEKVLTSARVEEVYGCACRLFIKDGQTHFVFG